MWILLRFRKYKVIDIYESFLNADLRKSNADKRRFLREGYLRPFACPPRRAFGETGDLRESALKNAFSGIAKGSILINTLWILFILSLLALALAWRISLELKLSNYFVSQSKNLSAAKAGVMYAMEITQRDKKNNSYDALNEAWADKREIFENRAVGESIFNIRYIADYNPLRGEPIIKWGLIDEERKINLNLAENKLEPLLTNLKSVLNAQNQTILTNEIINAIVDWRDVNFETREGGKESEVYSYPCRNRKFKVLEELMLLKGIDKDRTKFDELKKYFTVYGSDGKINVNTAEEIVLKAAILTILTRIEIIYQGQPITIIVSRDIGERLAEEIIKSRKEPFETFNELVTQLTIIIAELFPDYREIILREGGPYVRQLIQGWLKVDSNCFQVNVEAQIRGTIKKKATAIFDRTKNQILYWYED